MTHTSRFLMGMATLVVAMPASSQDDPFARKWFWGAQGGASFQSTTRGNVTAVNVGGNWLITGSRSALYVSYDQEIFPAGTATDLGNVDVQFTNGRRINGSLLAFPRRGFFFGGGFTIHQVTDPDLSNNTFASQTAADAAQLAVDEAATKAFLTFTGGFQLPVSRGALLYATYQYMPGASDFLITSDIHALVGGLRISLGSSFEEISTDRR